MKHIDYCNISIILTFLIFDNCARQNDSSILKGFYLGQKHPGAKPEIFAPGIVSTEMEEFGCSFSLNATEFYFTRKMVDTEQEQNKMTIMVSRLGENGWSKPEIAPFCGGYFEGEPNFSPGGDFVLFGRLVEFEDGSQDARVFIAERKENGWSKPRDLMHGMFATITSDSVIYYTDISRGHSKGDIYRAEYVNGKCQRIEMLGGKINSPQQDAHPFVTPEGDLLIFDSNRHGGYGDNDLYICFRQDDGNWGDPVNMGAIVNTQKYDAIPYLTYDRKYFFFFRNNDIYWVDARFIEDLKPNESK
jgi:hypothetical protein